MASETVAENVPVLVIESDRLKASVRDIPMSPTAVTESASASVSETADPNVADDVEVSDSASASLIVAPNDPVVVTVSASAIFSETDEAKIAEVEIVSAREIDSDTDSLNTLPPA